MILLDDAPGAYSELVFDFGRLLNALWMGSPPAHELSKERSKSWNGNIKAGYSRVAAAHELAITLRCFYAHEPILEAITTTSTLRRA